MANPTYSTGTVSIANGATTVIGVGTIWSGVNAKAGDAISIDGLEPVSIKDVTDSTHIELWAPWAPATKSGQDYKIIQNYPARVVGVAAAQDVGTMLAKLRTDGLPFLLTPDETEPDPSYGADGQYAYQPTTETWWIKEDGVWELTGAPTGTRSKLQADRTYFVRIDGNDLLNSGLVDSAGGAFATGTGAWNYVRDNVDLNGYTVTIRITDATHTEAIIIDGPCLNGTVEVEGNVSNPALSLLWPSGACAFKITNAKVTISSIGLITDSGMAHVLIGAGADASYKNLRHGDATGAGDHYLITDGGVGRPIGNYVYGGSFGSHIHFRRGGKLLVPDGASITATAVGTPTAINYFVGGNAALADLLGMTWAGVSVSGPKFLLHNGCRLNTGGMGLSWLPGSTAGTFPDSWAWYDNMFCGVTGLSAGAALAADALYTANANTAASKALANTPQFHGVAANNANGGAVYDSYGSSGAQTILTGRLAYGTAGSETAVTAAAYIISFAGQSLDNSGNYFTNAIIDFGAANSQTGTDHGGFMRGRVVPPGLDDTNRMLARVGRVHGWPYRHCRHGRGYTQRIDQLLHRRNAA